MTEDQLVALMAAQIYAGDLAWARKNIGQPNMEWVANVAWKLRMEVSRRLRIESAIRERNKEGEAS